MHKLFKTKQPRAVIEDEFNSRWRRGGRGRYFPAGFKKKSRRSGDHRLVFNACAPSFP